MLFVYFLLSCPSYSLALPQLVCHLIFLLSFFLLFLWCSVYFVRCTPPPTRCYYLFMCSICQALLQLGLFKKQLESIPTELSLEIERKLESG